MIKYLINLIFLIILLLFSKNGYSQEGLTWYTPLNQDQSYDNNQYQCLFQATDSYLFDFEEVRGNNDYVGVHNYLIRDFNHDNYCDIFVAFFSSMQESTPFKFFIYNPQNGVLEDKSELIKNNTGQIFNRRSLAADFNEDGVLDIVLISNPEFDFREISHLDIVLSDSTGWTQVNLSTASRREEDEDPNDPFTHGYFHGLAVGDVNNDGHIDIVHSNWHQTKGLVTYLNNGDGTFSHFYAIENQELSEGNQDYPFLTMRMSFTNELADIDGDQCLDSIMSGNDRYHMLIAYGNCDGTFGDRYTQLAFNESTLQIFEPTLPRFISMVDLNIVDLTNDGIPDILGLATDYVKWQLALFEVVRTDSTPQIIEKTREFNEPLVERGFYEEYPSDEAWFPYIELLDVNDDGLRDIIVSATTYSQKYRSDWMLIHDGNESYRYAKYPVLIRNSEIHTTYRADEIAVSFDITQFADVGNHWLDQEGNIGLGYRNEIDYWTIYYDSTDWQPHDNQSVHFSTIDHSSMEKTNVKNSFDYTVNLVDSNVEFVADTVFLRFSYTDQFGVQSPLSPRVIGILNTTTSTQDTEFERESYRLHQNYPNPFNPTTAIRYSLPQATAVRLEVFNLLGQSVGVLMDGLQQAGTHVVDFDASDLSTGVYFYRLTTPAFTQTRQMMLIK